METDTFWDFNFVPDAGTELVVHRDTEPQLLELRDDGSTGERRTVPRGSQLTVAGSWVAGSWLYVVHDGERFVLLSRSLACPS